jgi:nucleoside-diphosphate-sugar epimerase
MKNKVLITGASGFVGFHLVEEALRQNLEVYAAIRPSSPTAHLRSLPVHLTALPYLHPAGLQKLLEAGGYDYIIHAAGLTRAKTPGAYNTVNATYTRNLGQAAVRADMPLRRFVFISSLAALGPASAETAPPISPFRVPRPVTAYGKSKLLAEEYLGNLPDLPLVTLRPTAVYGPRERDLYLLIRTVARGLEPYIGHQAQKLSFLYVKDLAEITVRALQLPGRNHLSYNLSDGNSYDRYAFAEVTKKLLHKKTLRFHLPLPAVRALAGVLEGAYALTHQMPALNREKLRELSAANWSCSIREPQRDLGFSPRYNLETGLAETLAWYKDNKWL